jgi:UDP-N-acetylmuramyl pentapeptide synthase
MINQMAQRLLRKIAHNQLEKLKLSYYKIHNKRLPVIVVVGTVGKSSVTLLISQLLEANNYKVISGTSQQKNLNTTSGLAMSLGNFYFELSSGNKIWNWLKLFTLAFWTTIFPKVDLGQPTVLVSEVGFDYQNEAQNYEEIFGNIDLLVVTAATWEHNQGFEEHVNSHRVNFISKHLPDYWSQTLSSKLHDGRLRNIALEQLWLTRNSHYVVLPEKIGEISNTILTNINQSEAAMDSSQTNIILEAESSKPRFYTSTADANRVNGILVSGRFVYNSKYLLPKSFARTSLILDSVVKALNLEEETVAQTLSDCNLPFGRFGFFNGLNETKIVDSTYNSDPASLGYFLDTLEEVINNEPDFGNPTCHTLILGEMRELGATAVIEHKNILNRLIDLQEKYPRQFLEIYLLGQEWQKCSDEATTSWFVKYKGQMFKRYESAQKINKEIDKIIIQKGSWFWVKGSQNTIFLEVVVEHLLANPEDKKFLCRQEEKWKR